MILATLLTIASWSYLYLRAHGRTVRMPGWVESVKIRLYVLFMHRLYADEFYRKLGQLMHRATHRVDKHAQGWAR